MIINKIIYHFVQPADSTAVDIASVAAFTNMV